MKYLFNFILLHVIFATPQINLHYTDWVSENENNNVLQHDCLRVPASINEAKISREIISYCMNELPSKFHIENNDIFPKFTFVELSKLNITSQQLYYWSAPIDLIERYQFYLNQLLISNAVVLEKQIFYNCTLPRFGSMCQYEIIYYHSNHSSLYEVIHDYYRLYEYNPTNLTCYTHLQCNRGSLPACLDWSEICNGQVDCLDGNFDEEHCWQLEINDCNENEYRCINGQCIPQSFFRDDSHTPDCFDGSDEVAKYGAWFNYCSKVIPSFECEEKICEYTFLTSSCVLQRQNLLIEAIYSDKDNSVSEQCWLAFKCVLAVPGSEEPMCHNICKGFVCVEIIQSTCPDMFYIPNVPILFGEIYLLHTINDSRVLASRNFARPYVCHNNSRYDEYFIHLPNFVFENRTCFYPLNLLINLALVPDWFVRYHKPLDDLYRDLKRFNLVMNYTTTICKKANMYQCLNSIKCIPINRLMDRRKDCPYRDDEDLTKMTDSNLTELLKSHFKCEMTNKYISQSIVQDKACDCKLENENFCEDEDFHIHYARKNISFQTICDGFTELIPITIDGQNETDETECEKWSCNNIYTSCDGLWNCPRGEDEIGCDILSTLNCSAYHHKCVLLDTNQLICLSIEKVNNGKVDCLGGTDEPTLCRQIFQDKLVDKFFCLRQNRRECILSAQLCDGEIICDHGDDEKFCQNNYLNKSNSLGICNSAHSSIRSDVEQFLCHEATVKTIQEIKYFSLEEMSKNVDDQTKNVFKSLFPSSSIIKQFHQHKPRCHRGFDVRIWLNNQKNLTTDICFCPPSFYGDQCQYQNQRVSLTIKFRALSDSWSTLFAIIISLIDDSDERIIHSYEQFTYLSMRDCKVKFNIYLLYSTRPKNQTKNYAIHIDIYEKVSLSYRGSLLFPIIFPFLPVYRMAYKIDIPQNNQNMKSCSNSRCIHGKCIMYLNNRQNTHFCQCYQGWSGRYCTIPHRSMCSSDSLNIGVSAYNQSICLCPIHKFGYRCLLVNTICEMNNNYLKCLNGGKCIPADEYTISKQKFLCICARGYIGDRCEIVDNQIILSFNNDIVLSQSIFIHFIQVLKDGPPVRTTTFRTISLIKHSLTIYWSHPFNLIFIELLNKIYYLVIVQKSYEQSIIINKTINPSDYCPHMNELFNETFVKMHLIRRIKYYHLPCQNYSLNISCFHDDHHICLCYDYKQKRLANCLDFNHNMKFDCLGESVCENNGQCFQDTPDCPQKSICICPSCVYGTRCQFSANLFGLSLDPIIGYHIQPHINFTNQPTIVKISSALTIIFIIVGFVNGILSLITFINKNIREVGCGLYLLGSSITTLLTTIIFGLKFCILVFAQMALISNRSFLKIQCLLLDFILRVCLNIDQWLNACVAIERAITIIKAARFHKKKSKQIAKIVIIIIPIVVIVTTIYDPFYRRLIDEENEDDKRIWCIVNYSIGIKIFNSIIHTFHFLAPLMINITSVIILITKKTRHRSNIQTGRSYIEHLKEQIHQHKHLFTAPVILVILGLPRLILLFVSTCMKSTDDAWLFLVGYFISFIPSMLTFVVFILPSKFYKQQLRQTLTTYLTQIQRRFQFIM